MVKDPYTGAQVVNVERASIEDHLVMARKFVLAWMIRRNPPPEWAVIRQLAHIDIHIRRRWLKPDMDVRESHKRHRRPC